MYMSTPLQHVPIAHRDVMSFLMKMAATQRAFILNVNRLKCYVSVNTSAVAFIKAIRGIQTSGPCGFYEAVLELIFYFA